MQRYTQAELRADREAMGKRCKHCGTIFYPEPGKGKNFHKRVFCSKACVAKDKSKDPRKEWLAAYRKSVPWTQPEAKIPHYPGFEIVTDCRPCCATFLSAR